MLVPRRGVPLEGNYVNTHSHTHTDTKDSSVLYFSHSVPCYVSLSLKCILVCCFFLFIDASTLTCPVSWWCLWLESLFVCLCVSLFVVCLESYWKSSVKGMSREQLRETILNIHLEPYRGQCLLQRVTNSGIRHMVKKNISFECVFVRPTVWVKCVMVFD